MTEALAVDLEAPCWIWLGPLNGNGYGRFGAKGDRMYGHRYMWEQMRGPIPKEVRLELHHLCENKLCINPQHLQLLTPLEHIHSNPRNLGHLHSLRTHCNQGHPFDSSNTRMEAGNSRRCKTCKSAYMKEYKKTYVKPNA